MSKCPCNDFNQCTTDFCCAFQGTDPKLCAEQDPPEDPNDLPACYHKPRWPFHDEAVLCSSLGCTGTITVPGRDYVALNNDDDNRNGFPDYFDVGAVVGEDDLVPVDINFESCLGSCEGEPANGWQIFPDTPYYSLGVILYFDSVKSSRVDTSGYSYPFPAPSQVFMEGLELSTVCGVPLAGGLTRAIAPGEGANVCCHAESLPVYVVTVASLEWEPYREFDVINPDLETCPINGGKRIFTGKIDPSDLEATSRRYVWLVATVEPPIPGVTVHMRVWDVDDPFNQLYGPNHAEGVTEIPGVSTVDPSDTYGNDNRGGVGGLTTFQVTGPDGRAYSRVTTSRQPGDNYRAAATCLRDVLTETSEGRPPQVDQGEADALSVTTDAAGKFVPNGGDSGYKVPVVWSKMLTVWRKLHVEVDSMMAPDFTNTQTGIIPLAPTFNATNNHAFITLAGLEPDFNKDDQHMVGRIDVLSFGSFVTIATVKGPPPIVEIINAPPNIVTAAGVSYNLWDDDAGSVPPFVMVAFNAPPVTLPKVLDTSLMDDVFQMAYVDVPAPDMQYYDATTAFDRNVEENEAADKGKENRDLTSESGYWVVHITSAFQGYTDKDGDPDIEQAGEGLQYGVTKPTGFFGGRRAGSLVYLETIRDDKRGNATVMAELERYTVTHEAGHQFKLEHTDGRFPDSNDTNPSDDYIMTDKTGDTGMAPNVGFSAKSLKKIREIEYPPQP